MQESQDSELLRQYARENSDEAFAALVTRHVNMVYSAALRKTGNPAAAEEITQAVFVILAKKANGLLRHTALSGWLYQAARLTAANFLRTEIRRTRREQEAYMQSLSNQTEPEIWPQIMPLLEDAMGRLGEKDRNALALRFFEGKSFQEIGTAFGVSENAARKRTDYALEKLRVYFSKRGVTSTTETIAGAISANSVQAAPVALAKAVDRRGDCQGRDGFDFNLNPHQRSIENYGLDKSENSNRCQRVCVAGGGNNDPHHLQHGKAHAHHSIRMVSRQR